MKHILNNISQEEKQRILEQHSGGKTIDTSKFRQLLESKLGDVKPLIMEQRQEATAALASLNQWLLSHPYQMESWAADRPSPNTTDRDLEIGKLGINPQQVLQIQILGDTDPSTKIYTPNKLIATLRLSNATMKNLETKSPGFGEKHKGTNGADFLHRIDIKLTGNTIGNVIASINKNIWAPANIDKALENVLTLYGVKA